MMTRRDWGIALVLIAVVTLLALPILTYPLGRDQGVFGTIARVMLAGGRPYLDAWDFKPPPIYYIYAGTVALFGPTTAALRAIDLILFAPLGLALYWLALRLSSRRAAIIAMLVGGAFYFSESFWTLTQNDGVAMLPMTLAAVCTFKAAERGSRGWLWALLSGACAALAAWFKYPFVLFGAALAASYLITIRSRGVQLNAPTTRVLDNRSGVFRLGIAFLAGALLVGLGGIAYLASVGLWDATLESALLAGRYVAQDYSLPALFDSPVWKASLADRWSRWHVLFLLAAAWPVLRWRLRRGKEVAPLGWPIIWLWGASVLVVLLIQAKGIDYQWLPLLPPLALIAADAVDRVIEALQRFRAGTRSVSLPALAHLAIVLILLAHLAANLWLPVLPYLAGQESREAYYSRFRGGEFVADESLAVANYLRERVAPGDSLYIWGFRPEIYYLASLRPATRFISQFPLVVEGYPAAWRQENVDLLWAALPPYVLVLQGDFMPWVTGRDADSNTLLQEYPELNNWLMFNYERETQIGNFFIWRRKD